MPSIGSVIFIRIDREVRKPGEVVEDISRGGVDGVALLKRGFRGFPFRLSCTADYASEIEFQDTYDTLRDMRATVQTWVNNEGTTFNNRLGVLNVNAGKRPMQSPVGGLKGTLGKFIGVFTIECVDIGVT